MSDIDRLEQRIDELERQVKNLQGQLQDAADQAGATYMLLDLLLTYNSKGTPLTMEELKRVAPHIYDLENDTSADYITSITEGWFETLLELDQIPDPQDKP